MKFEEILKTKPHNEFYLDRYIKFIYYCIEKNKDLKSDTYTEIHHICPQAKSLFIEYKNLKLNTWNKIILTGRQHFLAHWMLWKAYGNTMSYAFFAMKRKSKHQQNRYFKINAKIYEQLKLEVSIILKNRVISDETKSKMSKAQKNSIKSQCPHCDLIGSSSNMRRWHFNNCKKITGKLKHDTNQNYTIVTCPHCNKTGKLQGMYANHFDNCNIIRGNYRKINEFIICDICQKEGSNTQSFIRHHFNNCGKKQQYIKNLEKVTCPHCNKTGSSQGMKGTHFNNCPSIRKKIKCSKCNKIGKDHHTFRAKHKKTCNIINFIIQDE